MKRIRDQKRSDTRALGRTFGVSAVLLGLTIGAGCGEVASGVGGESHFACSTNASCAPHDGVPFCIDGYCQSTADTLADASSGGSGAGVSGIDSGSAPGAGGASNTGGAGGNAGSGGSLPMLKCEGGCCPTSSTCYSDPASGIDSPGSECLATHDNTGQDHIQLRQAWVRATAPTGNTNAVVYGVDSSRTQLPQPECFQGLDEATKGTGGYIELVDLFLGGADLTKHSATIGYSTFVPASALATTLTSGLCFGSETYHEGNHGTPPPPAPSDGGVVPPTPVPGRYALTTAAITSPTDSVSYPHGLPLPMGLAEGWQVAPTKAKRLATDFDLASARVALLAKLAADGEYGSAGFTGVFFYDGSTGYLHGYAPLSWNVLYGRDGQSHLAVPVREAETKSTFNDPTHPNCVGAFRGGALSPSTGCKSRDPKNPAWGCYQDGPTGALSCMPGDAPATTDGYSLITELEQLYSPDLQSTLCVSYPGKYDSMGNPDLGAGFYTGSTTESCRGPAWDPTKADGSGIPVGDWCAATNGPATATCHDAWHTKTFQVFTGAKIKVPADSTMPMTTCAF